MNVIQGYVPTADKDEERSRSSGREEIVEVLKLTKKGEKSWFWEIGMLKLVKEATSKMSANSALAKGTTEGTD